MFLDITEKNRDLHFNTNFVDFNFTHVGRLSESRPVVITNKYAFPIEVSWNLLKVYNKITEQWVSNPFKVRPPTKVIEANSAFEFSADFCPYEPDQYFF